MPALDHSPQGHDPCKKCGEPAAKHRVKHHFVAAKDGSCEVCGLKGVRHRVRKRSPAEIEAQRIRSNAKPRSDRRSYKEREVYAGIDGEGKGRRDHKYVLLAWRDEYGKRADWIEDHEKGLGTKECLDFLLNIPPRIKIFGFSTNYDLTMMLRDVEDPLLYLLFRPELRQRPEGSKIAAPFPVRWKGYRLNLQGTKFYVARGSRRRTVWDVWKFYQSKFVKALQDWKVGDKETHDRLTVMKDKRGESDKWTTDEMRTYCLSECTNLGQLVRKLVQAHAEVGLELTSFYGAGSTANLLLKHFGIGEKRGTQPAAMQRAIASGFFGGRFEHSVIGAIGGPYAGH
jgi:hypothetical protein